MQELPNYNRPHDTSEESTELCWCNPTVKIFDNGARLIVHHDPVEAVEEAEKILEQSKPFEQ